MKKIKQNIVFIYLLSIISCGKNKIINLPKDKKAAEYYKISEKKLDPNNPKDIFLKSGKCVYKLKIKIKTFQMEKLNKELKVTFTMILNEKIRSKHKNPKTNQNTNIKSVKTEKNYELKQKLKIQNLQKMDLDSAQMRIFIKDVFWKYDPDVEKMINKPKYLFIKLDKENIQQSQPEEEFQFIDIPCDTQIPNVKLIKSDFDKTDATENNFLIFSNDIEILDLDLDFEISFLRKEHLEMKRDEIKNFFCRKFNFEKLKYRSMKYKLKICEK